MPETTARIASILLALAFAWAGTAKLFAYRRWRDVLEHYELPRRLRFVVAPVVPVAELAIAGVILFLSPRVGAIVSVGVLAAFSLAIMRARAFHGDALPCGCFGGSSDRNYQTMVVRNAVLGTLATIVLISRLRTGIGLPPAPTGADAVPVALVIVGCAVGLWTALHVASSLRRREHP